MSEHGPETLIAEEELFEALAPERPDPAEFEAAVKRKVAERDAWDEPARSVEPPQGWLRRAAAILPPGMLESLALGPAVAAVGKKTAAKAAPGLLAVPFVSLAVMAVCFVGALRALAHPNAEAARSGADPDRPGRAAARSYGLFADGWLSLFGMGAILLLFYLRTPETSVLFLLGAMMFVVVVLRSLSREGLATRAHVAWRCASLSTTIGIYATMLESIVVKTTRSYLDPTWAIYVLWGGGLVCALLGFRADRTSGRHRHVLLIATTLGLSAFFVFLRMPSGYSPDPSRVERWVERFDYRIGELNHWKTLGHAVTWLESQGRDDLGLEGARAVIEDALSEGADLHPSTRLGALRAGVLSPDEYSEELDAYRARKLVEDDQPFLSLLSDELTVELAIANDGLDASERAWVADRLRRSWPEEVGFDVLDRMATLVEMAEQLGYPELFADRTESVHAALLGSWAGRPSDRIWPAGFTRQPESIGKYALFLGDGVPPTARAIELLLRFGVPEGLELERVRAYLRDEARILFPLRKHPHVYRTVANLAYDRYDTKVGFPTPSVARFLASERVLVGALLTALLCIWATVRSSPGPEARAAK